MKTYLVSINENLFSSDHDNIFNVTLKAFSNFKNTLNKSSQVVQLRSRLHID